MSTDPKESAMPDGENSADVPASFDAAKERVPSDLQGRSNAETTLSKRLEEIPADASRIDEAVEKVQMLVVETYAFIRSQVCDQVELFAESFFKMPMLRSLEQDMTLIELSELDKMNQEERRERLTAETRSAQEGLIAIDSCVKRLQSFK